MILLNPGGYSGLFAKQARELGMLKPIWSGIQLEDAQELESSHGALADARYVVPRIDEGFRTRYSSTYGSTYLVSIAAVYYDLTKALAALAEIPPSGQLIDQL